jgi:hypothetical protein
MIRKTITLIALATLLLAGSPLLAENGAAEDGEQHHVFIQKTDSDHSCEEDECPHMQRRIFISEDGTTTELHGEDMKWVHEGGEHAMFVGGQRAFLGVQFSELTPELREHFGVPAAAGVMVSKVVEDSPAERAGVRVGDILTRVGEKDIASGRDLMKAVGHAEDGETVNLEIWRANRVQTVAATLETREQKMGMHKMAFHGAESEGEGLHKVIEIQCDDEEGGDCAMHVGHDGGMMGLDWQGNCEGSDECEVRVQCEEDGCTCTVNGEEADCPEGIDD